MSEVEPAPHRFAKTKWEWEQQLKARSRAEGMKPGVQHIALLLSTYADADGTSIRPTSQTLRDVSGRSLGTIADALKALRHSGWIEQVSRGSGGARQASVHRLTIPHISEER